MLYLEIFDVKILRFVYDPNGKNKDWDETEKTKTEKAYLFVTDLDTLKKLCTKCNVKKF